MKKDKKDIFFIYETTNLINGMKYRGIHKTKNINDKYLGSGTTFINAVKKYGKENFKREILEFCDSYDELLEKEKNYVNEKWVKNRNNYNIKTGGQNCGILSDESKNKISKTLKEKYKNGELIPEIGNWIKENGNWLSNGGIISEETKEKCSKSGKERYKNDEKHPLKLYRNAIPWNKGKKGVQKMSEKTKATISKTLKEKYKNGEIIKSHKPLSEETKNKISESLKKSPFNNKGKILKKIECPHCGKFVDKGNGNRWHFDNCKLKNKDN